MGLATRIIPVLLFDEHGCVKGRQFSKNRRIGSMSDRLRLLERRDIDEIILLDVSATPTKRGPRFEEVKSYCHNLFCPITVGGGIRNVADAKRILAEGADKISVNTAALERPELINELSQKFGAQSVVIAIDVLDDVVRSHCGNNDSNKKPIEWAIECQERGAGEILLTDIARDGTLSGFNLELIRQISSAVSIPVIAAGGCGSYDDMKEAITNGAHAVAAGALFQFCEETPKGASRYLKANGIAARV